jgi:hypothetical protein
VNPSWCLHGDGHTKKLETKNLIALTDRKSRIRNAAGEVSLRFRDQSGSLRHDNSSRLTVIEDTGKAFLFSVPLARELLSRNLDGVLLFVHLEQAADIVRVTVSFSSYARLDEISKERPELRFGSYDLPPTTVTEIEPSLSRDGMDEDGLYEVLSQSVARSYIVASLRSRIKRWRVLVCHRATRSSARQTVRGPS